MKKNDSRATTNKPQYETTHDLVALNRVNQIADIKDLKIIIPANQPGIGIVPASHALSSLEISRTISLARILLIVGLVFLHYLQFPNSATWPYTGLNVKEHSFATWLNSTVFFFFLSVVPLLSMISGWLFFSFKDNNNPWPTVFARIRRRAVSLYMPLVFWNGLILAGLYAIFKMNPQYPLLSQLNMDFNTAGFKGYINAVFGITQRPIGFQFWFVRDLFVTALVSPLFLLMIRRMPWLGAAALGIAWICASPMVIFLRPDVPFFFYLGALVRMKQLPMTIPLKVALGVAGLFVTLACVRALAPLVVNFDGDVVPGWLRVVTSLMRFVGVVGCWGVLQHLAQTKQGGKIGNYGGLAFFLHSAHWPLLVFLKIWLWPFVPAQNDFWMLAHDLTCVTLTVVIGLGLGIFLNRYLPAAFALMNGGRLLGQTKA